MNIGIIVYSRTGHTLSVAKKLKEKLSADGHVVALEQIETVGPTSPSAAGAELKTKPATGAYDALVLGSPVQGGVPAGAMLSYLNQLPPLEGRPVALLVTGVFPYAWGRLQALAKMAEICMAKGATICGSASVGWWSLKRRQQITQAADNLSALF